MKKLLALTMALVLCLGLAACGGDTTTEESTDTQQASGETVTLKVGATPAPHQEILEQVVDVLAEQGITLEIVPYMFYCYLMAACAIIFILFFSGRTKSAG